MPRPIFWPLLGVPGPGLPPEGSEQQPPTPPPSSFAKKERPLEPWQTLAGANRQERGRCVTAQRETCVKVWGRGRPREGGSSSRRGRREPRLNRARCPGGGLSSSRLRRGVCSSWPGSGSPGGSGHGRPGLSSSGQGWLVSAAALSRARGGCSSWTDFCEPGEKPEFPSWPPGPLLLPTSPHLPW